MNANLTINNIEKNFNLKFNSNIEEKLFFEMFNVLLESRISTNRTRHISRRIHRPIVNSSKIFSLRKKREVTLFDIEICLAALCMLNWPGKTSEYKQEINEIKNLYYYNTVTRTLILNSLKNNISSTFKNIKNKNEKYFFNLNDLII